MATAFTSWYPYVLPETPGCPSPLATQAVRDAVVEFCERTKLWHQDLTALNITDGTSEYTLTLPASSAVVCILHARDNDEPIDEKSEAILDAEGDNLDLDSASSTSDESTNWRWLESDQAQYFYQPTRSKIRLVPMPNTSRTASLDVHAALKPLPAATTCEDFLFNEWYKEIAAGAKAYLLDLPQKPWRDTQRSLINRSIFNDAVARATSEQRSSNTRGERKVRRARGYAV